MRRARWLVPVFFFLNVWGMTTRGRVSVSGDEPHYLMIAESLLSDRDLDLRNNYERGDGRWFAVPDIRADLQATETPSGALWSAHDIGVPVVLLVPYSVLTRAATLVPERWLARFRMSHGALAYTLIGLTLAAGVAIGLAWVLAGLARIIPARDAALVTLVIGLAPPIFSHASLVFPETIALVVVCAVVWLLCQDSRELSATKVGAIAVAVGGLPWLHRKYSFLAIGIACVILIQHRPWFATRTKRVALAIGALFLLPQIALHIWTYSVWGYLGGPHMRVGVPFALSWVPDGAAGLLFDRERGLAGYAPIYLIAPAGFALAWARSRWLLIPIVSLFVPMAAFLVWAGGYAPAARHIVPLMPLVALGAAPALRWRPFRWAAGLLLGFQILIGAAVWSHPRVLWPKEVGTNAALEKIPVLGPAYARALPSILTGDPAWRAWPILVATVLLSVGVVAASRRSSR